ncbi:hypothetical protein ZIOFF_003848 [Zingiber officinale]|uniref:Cyclic nucleotide-binding domain-containing protein n=1 Tax=Zingiber officinale TaxID=94328 RepID=A0A8J5IDZ7_ZINOF|nr:hypothetical protein ZIOFF_003848 [Zingiber officinale]
MADTAKVFNMPLAMMCGIEAEKEISQDGSHYSLSTGILPSLGARSNRRVKLRRFIISPYDRRYRAREIFLIVLVVYSAWVSPFEFGFLGHAKGTLALVDNIVNAFFAIDIILTFFLAYLDRTTYLLVDDPKLIAWKYLTSWFVLDVASTIPSELARKLFNVWLQEERTAAISLASKMVESMKSQAVLARFYEGKEPIQFFCIFQSFQVFKMTYSEEGIAVFRVQGSGPENMQAIQVEPVGGFIFEFIKLLHTALWTYCFCMPNLQPKTQKERTEIDQFWNLLGGKSEYSSQKIAKEPEYDPHLFLCSFFKGKKLEVVEIFNFTQDDLMTEDMFILDCHSDIYVWVGQQLDAKIRQQALSIVEVANCCLISSVSGVSEELVHYLQGDSICCALCWVLLLSSLQGIIIQAELGSVLLCQISTSEACGSAMTDSEGLQQQETLDALPKAIRSSITHYLFYSLVQSVYLFHGVSNDLLFQLVSEMKAEYYPPREDVILQNEAPTDFYILVIGTAVDFDDVILLLHEGFRVVVRSDVCVAY